jgi:N-acetylneuraminic acid mutarotase
MKKLFKYFILIISMCALLIACGGGGGGGNTPTSAGGGGTTSGGGGGTTQPVYSGFNFSLATGAYWEFCWAYKHQSWAQGSSPANTYDNGNFRVTLGNPQTIQGVTAYEIIVTGDSIDVDNHNYAPGWKWIAMDKNKILGSKDGTTLEVIFDANTGKWLGGGFFTTFSATSGTSTGTLTFTNKFIDTQAISVSRSLSQSLCETISGYTVCPNDTSYDLSENEYYKGGIGPVGYRFSYGIMFTGGGFSSGSNDDRDVGLVATSFTAADGFVPHYPWLQKTTIPSQRTSYSVASLNNKIYIMGGKISSAATSSIDVYDPATDTWSAGGSLPHTMYGQQSQTVNGKIYVFHGDQGVGTSTQLWESNASVTAWTQKASMPSVFQSYSNLTSAASSTLIFLPVPDTTYYHTRCYAYDVASNQWLSLTEKPSGYDQSSFVAWSGSSFYIMGGRASGILETIYIIDNWRVDPQPIGFNDIWTQKALMPEGRYSSISVTLNGNIYVLGGRGKMGELGRVDMYDPVANTWTTKSPMPGSGSGSGVVCNGKIYVINNGRIYEYDPAKE